MRSGDLSSATVEFGGRRRPLLDLVDSWARHVRRFARESSGADFDSSWGVYDYIAALHIRDAVARGLGDQPDLPPPVAAADELLRRFTEPDHDRLLQRAEPDAPRDPWWWQRVPSAGPVATDLAALKD